MEYVSSPAAALCRQLTGDVFDFVLEAPPWRLWPGPASSPRSGCPATLPISLSPSAALTKPLSTLRFVFQIGARAPRAGQFQPGSTIEIFAPLGNGFPVDKSKRTLLVGGGIGVPPLLGVAAQLGEGHRGAGLPQ
ncbi:MAG: hypothetical protein ACLRSY_05865 [Acutalibacter sp.]